MKKLLTFVLALSMVASTCLYAQAVKKNKPKAEENAEEPGTLLVYACTPGLIRWIQLIQTDTKLAPSFIEDGGSYYAGEAVSGGSYKCTFVESEPFSAAKIIYFYEYGLGLPNEFDFVLPKEKDKIIYLVFKNYDGTEADAKIYGDVFWIRNKTPEEKAKIVKEVELKHRKKAVKKMRIKYSKTKWEPLLKEELEKIENLQKKLKKGEDLGDEE